MTTRRTTYTIAGQAVAVRVLVVGISNNVLHLHNAHVGSNSVMSYSSSAAEVSGSRTRYLPYGDWRTTPTQTYTDRGYTGQLEDMELGLYYYNARYYLPGIGRFASADTIVPQPGNPQSFSRYSYVLNRPLNLVDPTGHMQMCPTDTSCDPGHEPPPPPSPIDIDQDDWDEDEVATIEQAVQGVGNALARAHNSFAMRAFRIGAIDSYQSLTARDAFLAVYGGRVRFHRPGISCEVALERQCFGSSAGRTITVYTNADGATAGNHHFIVHELGHSFESRVNALLGNSYVRNRLGGSPDIARRDLDVRDGPNNGFAGPLWGWQQSGSATTGEEFADMFMGWTYNRWQLNLNTRLLRYDLTGQGSARSAFMNANMPSWVNLVVTN